MKSIVSLLADPVSFDVRHATLAPSWGGALRDETKRLLWGLWRAYH